jgi:hypothetical protein
MTAVAAGIYTTGIADSAAAGGSQAEALADGFSQACVALAIFAASSIVFAFVARRRTARPHAVDYAAAAASTTHTLPVTEAP